MESETGTLSSSFIDEPSRIGIVVASLLFVAAVLWFNKNNDFSVAVTKTPDTNVVEEPSRAKAKGEESKSPAEGDGKLRNVFSVKQKTIVTGGGSISKNKSSDRPFESSYYFAHNKHSTG